MKRSGSIQNTRGRIAAGEWFCTRWARTIQHWPILTLRLARPEVCQGVQLPRRRFTHATVGTKRLWKITTPLSNCCPAEPRYKDRGGLLVRMRQFDRAIEDLNEAVRLEPNRASAYLNRGAAWNGLGQYEQAIEDLSKAIELDPDNAGAFTNRGLAQFGLGRYDQSLADLNNAIQLAPRGDSLLQPRRGARAIGRACQGTRRLRAGRPDRATHGGCLCGQRHACARRAASAMAPFAITIWHCGSIPNRSASISIEGTCAGKPATRSALWRTTIRRWLLTQSGRPHTSPGAGRDTRPLWKGPITMPESICHFKDRAIRSLRTWRFLLRLGRGRPAARPRASVSFLKPW